MRNDLPARGHVELPRWRVDQPGFDHASIESVWTRDVPGPRQREHRRLPGHGFRRLHFERRRVCRKYRCDQRHLALLHGRLAQGNRAHRLLGHAGMPDTPVLHGPDGLPGSRASMVAPHLWWSRAGRYRARKRDRQERRLVDVRIDRQPGSLDPVALHPWLLLRQHSEHDPPGMVWTISSRPARAAVRPDAHRKLVRWRVALWRVRLVRIFHRGHLVVRELPSCPQRSALASPGPLGPIWWVYGLRFAGPVRCPLRRVRTALRERDHLELHRQHVDAVAVVLAEGERLQLAQRTLQREHRLLQ